MVHSTSLKNCVNYSGKNSRGCAAHRGSSGSRAPSALPSLVSWVLRAYAYVSACVRWSYSLSLFSPEVCGDVVADDQTRGEEEPKYPVENVVGNELELRHYHANRNDCPGQLTNLPRQKHKTTVRGKRSTNAKLNDR